jgi:tRNA pseudouridine55 synthase
VIDGLVVVDKNAGWTSHDVVARCRRVYGQRKVGHAGTLDPGATGVLLVGLGRATRLLRFLTALPKSYEGEVVFGLSTSTLDDGGDETGRWDMTGLNLDRVRRTAATMVGPIFQVPPMVSAIRVEGRRLHQLARAGVEVERAPRPVEVHRLDVEATDDPQVFRIRVWCSSGTYVRVLAADMGTALGGGAHLRRLRRTGVGSFTIEQARTLGDLEETPAAAVLSASEAMRDYPSIAVRPDVAALVAHGRALERDELGATGDGPWALVDGRGSLLAVYGPDADDAVRVVPAVVLSGSAADR